MVGLDVMKPRVPREIREAASRASVVPGKRFDGPQADEWLDDADINGPDFLKRDETNTRHTDAQAGPPWPPGPIALECAARAAANAKRAAAKRAAIPIVRQAVKDGHYTFQRIRKATGLADTDIRWALQWCRKRGSIYIRGHSYFVAWE